MQEKSTAVWHDSIIQGSKEWYKLRENRIGSSDAGPIIGACKYKSPYKLWCQKQGLLPQDEENEAMRWGKRLEPIARSVVSEMLNIDFRANTVTNDWQIASLDGVSSDRRHLLEIKCPMGPSDHECAMDGQVPNHYKPQLMHIMHVCGMREIYYFSYSKISQKVIHFEQSDTELEKLLKAEKVFWDSLFDLNCPEPSEKDYTNRHDFEWTLLSDQWRDVKRQMESLEAREDMLRDRLIELSDGKNSMGNGIRIQKVIRKGGYDYKKAAESTGINLEPYRKPSVEMWRIT